MLNANEFFEMFCPEGMRSESNKVFENMQRKKFQRAQENWKTGFCTDADDQQCAEAAVEQVQEAFEFLDGDKNGGLELDELVGHLDEKSARTLMEAFDLNGSGRISLNEFEQMVDPNQTAFEEAHHNRY